MSFWKSFWKLIIEIFKPKPDPNPEPEPEPNPDPDKFTNESGQTGEIISIDWNFQQGFANIQYKTKRFIVYLLFQ